MPDKFSKEIRSRVMSRIRSKNTDAELALKRALKGMNFRFHPKIRGNPDFGNKRKKIAIFVDGCFWHKCPECYIEPKSNRKYWLKKIDGNAKRDKKISQELAKDGWRVLRFWEHQIKNNLGFCVRKTSKLVSESH